MAGGTAKTKLKKGEADRTEKCVHDVTIWSNPVEESTSFVEAAFQNYEVLVDDKRARKIGEAGPSGRYDTRSGPKRNDTAPARIQEKEKGKVLSSRLSSEIEKTMDLRKVLEERMLDSRVELTLREVLGIARRELHDKIVDLVKRKLLATEPEPENLVEVRAALLDEVATKDELAEKSLYKAALGMSNDIKPSSYRGYEGTNGGFD